MDGGHIGSHFEYLITQGFDDDGTAINEFLIPQNLIIDTKITCLSSLVSEIEVIYISGGHLGSHLEYLMRDASYADCNALNEFLTPQNMVIDTKITILGGLVTEIQGIHVISGHFGSHLEFLPYCRGRGALPNFFFNYYQP